MSYIYIYIVLWFMVKSPLHSHDIPRFRSNPREALWLVMAIFSAGTMTISSNRSSRTAACWGYAHPNDLSIYPCIIHLQYLFVHPISLQFTSFHVNSCNFISMSFHSFIDLKISLVTDLFIYISIHSRLVPLFTCWYHYSNHPTCHGQSLHSLHLHLEREGIRKPICCARPCQEHANAYSRRRLQSPWTWPKRVSHDASYPPVNIQKAVAFHGCFPGK